MGFFNKKGVQRLHALTTPLAVNSMSDAAEAISKRLEQALIADSPRHVDMADPVERLKFAQNLAWLIGFDRLIEDRNEIHEITSLIVEPGK